MQQVEGRQRQLTVAALRMRVGWAALPEGRWGKWRLNDPDLDLDSVHSPALKQACRPIALRVPHSTWYRQCAKSLCRHTDNSL